MTTTIAVHGIEPPDFQVDRYEERCPKRGDCCLDNGRWQKRVGPDAKRTKWIVAIPVEVGEGYRHPTPEELQCLPEGAERINKGYYRTGSRTWMPSIRTGTEGHSACYYRIPLAPPKPEILDDYHIAPHRVGERANGAEDYICPDKPNYEFIHNDWGAGGIKRLSDGRIAGGMDQQTCDRLNSGKITESGFAWWSPEEFALHGSPFPPKVPGFKEGVTFEKCRNGEWCYIDNTTGLSRSVPPFMLAHDVLNAIDVDWKKSRFVTREDG